MLWTREKGTKIKHKHTGRNAIITDVRIEGRVHGYQTMAQITFDNGERKRVRPKVLGAFFKPLLVLLTLTAIGCGDTINIEAPASDIVGPNVCDRVLTAGLLRGYAARCKMRGGELESLVLKCDPSTGVQDIEINCAEKDKGNKDD